MDLHNLYDWAAAVVGIASVLANVIKPYTIVGKVVHFLAFNFAGLLKANSDQSGTTNP